MRSSPFDWSEFLALATRLRASEAPSPPPEADLRTVVSRAYYFVYNAAGVKLGRRPTNTDGRPLQHGAFWEHLEGLAIPAWAQDVGVLRSNLQRLRHDSDYNERKTVTIVHADLAISSAIEAKKKLKL